MKAVQATIIFSILVSMTMGMSIVQQNFLSSLNLDNIQSMERYRDFNLGSRIVGGDIAALTQFPYQTAVFSILPWATGICGGVLLSERVVITAAHCMEQATSAVVVLGVHMLFDFNDPNRVEMEVSRQSFIIHDKYDAQMLYNDVALLILPKAVEFSVAIQKIDLPTGDDLNDSFEGVVATVSGFGRFSDHISSVSDVLRFTTNEVKANSACYDIFGNFVIESTLCTITRATRSGICFGDSGN